METTDWKTLLPTILGGINTILMSLGIYHLDNDTMNTLIAVISGLATLTGIILTHKKPS